MHAELAEAERKSGDLSNDLTKAEKLAKLQILTSPIDGTVEQLVVHTIGRVVTPAQALLAIVPSDSKIEVEAMISNRDIGFIHPGQNAEIKVDAFNFTRYGLLQGKVVSISHDAIVRDKQQERPSDRRALGSEVTSSEPSGQESLHSARIALNKASMNIDGKNISLMPGMAVTAEIKTGKRSILSYLLSPLVRYRSEALRER